MRNTQKPNIPKSKVIRADIYKPCEEEVEKYLLAWEQLENYKMQEKALDKLFFHTYPYNNSIEDCFFNDINILKEMNFELITNP